MVARNRKVYSIRNELIKKSQESALAAIQIFNNPLITFKSESFIVLMNIAWTYLLHAYFRGQNVEYRYFDQGNVRRKFRKTQHGAFRHWDLEKCLSVTECPLEDPIKDNLRFLIGIRHEIEHQMTDKIDSYISAKFQASCINYNSTLKSLFGDDYGLDNLIPISLQLFTFGEEQIDQLKDLSNLPKNIIDFVANFEDQINSVESPEYSYRVIYIRDNVNHENQADSAYRFITEDSAEGIDIQNILVKNKKHKKLTESEIVEKLKAEGFTSFNSQKHRDFWQNKWPTAQDRNESQEAKKYGELILKNQWLWYEASWLPEVRSYCQQNLSLQ